MDLCEGANKLNELTRDTWHRERTASSWFLIKELKEVLRELILGSLQRSKLSAGQLHAKPQVYYPLGTHKKGKGLDKGTLSLSQALRFEPSLGTDF